MELSRAHRWGLGHRPYNISAILPLSLQKIPVFQEGTSLKKPHSNVDSILSLSQLCALSPSWCSRLCVVHIVCAQSWHMLTYDLRSFIIQVILRRFKKGFHYVCVFFRYVNSVYSVGGTLAATSLLQKMQMERVRGVWADQVRVLSERSRLK